MALGFYFVHQGFTPDKYEEAIKQLAAAGQGAPNGRTLHVALESNGEIQVFDLWESQETFDAFGATLISHPCRTRHQTGRAHGGARAQRDRGLRTPPSIDSPVPRLSAWLTPWREGSLSLSIRAPRKQPAQEGSAEHVTDTHRRPDRPVASQQPEQRSLRRRSRLLEAAAWG